MTVLAAALVLAFCGFGGGYLAGFATLWEDWRERLLGWRDKGYRRFLDSERGRISRWTGLLQGKVCEAATCPTCAGWHAAWVTLLAWGTFGETGLDHGAKFAAWFAGSALHTIAMRAAMKLHLFDDNKPALGAR